jgi:hypothetical protein
MVRDRAAVARNVAIGSGRNALRKLRERPPTVIDAHEQTTEKGVNLVLFRRRPEHRIKRLNVTAR